MLYSEDYLNAGVPTFLNIYGLAATRSAVVVSSVLTVLLTAAAFYRLGFSTALLAILGASGLGLVGMALYGLVRSSNTIDRVLYKYSSIYMLAVMLLLVLAALKG
jgi:heme O synthase-like polyprenyltransferase